MTVTEIIIRLEEHLTKPGFDPTEEETRYIIAKLTAAEKLVRRLDAANPYTCVGDCWDWLTEYQMAGK